MFTDEPVEFAPAAGGVNATVSSPQFGGLNISPSGDAGVLLVTVMFNLSPGFTCRVGSSKPFGVIKQCSNRPAESVVCNGCDARSRRSARNRLRVGISGRERKRQRVD